MKRLVGILALSLLAGCVSPETRTTRLANNSISGIDQLVMTEQGTAPGTPASTRGVAYVCSTGELRFVNDAGLDSNIGPQSHGHMHFTQGQPDGSVAITAGTPQKIPVPTTGGFLRNFTHTSPGRLTYTGLQTIKVVVSVDMSAEQDGAGSTIIAYVALNGTIQLSTRIDAKAAAGGDHVSLSMGDVYELDTDDYIEVFVDCSSNRTVASDDFMVTILQFE